METVLGIFLGILLDADSKAAFAMYTALENRSAQRRMILAAAEAKLDLDHFEVLQAVMQTHVTPSMKERDRLAHWCWAYCPELPDALALAAPDEKIGRHFALIAEHVTHVQANPSETYVLTEGYLIKLGERIRGATERIGRFAATVWKQNPPKERAEFLQTLSSEPRIQEALVRLREARKNNRKVPQPSRQSKQNAKAK
jgi:hypothetical protein